MLKGPQAHEALQEALADIRREEAELLRRMARGSERLSRLRESEVELAGHAAQLRVEPGGRKAIAERFSGERDAARALFDRHAAETSLLDAKLAEFDRTLTELAGKRGQALSALAGRVAELNALLARMPGGLAGEAEARRQSEALEAIATKAEAEARRAVAQRAQKRRAYDRDPLFSYLERRGYGTKAHAARGVSRWLDERLAKLAGYEEARKTLVLLETVPRWRTAHAERARAAAEAAASRVAALRIEAIDRAGGRALREAETSLRDEIGGIDTRIERSEDARAALATDYATLVRGEDAAFSEAMARLDAAMRMETASVSEAADGPDARTALDKIAEARARAQEEAVDRREQTSRLATLMGRRGELEEIARRFRRERYDDPRQVFSEERLATAELDDFLKGALRAEAYWAMWRVAARPVEAGPKAEEEPPATPGGGVSPLRAAEH